MEHTLSPIVTGSSVVAVKYRDGVMLVTDTLCSYGSLKKFTGVSRIAPIGTTTVIAASGEYSDFQFIMDSLRASNLQETLLDDGDRRSSQEWAKYLANLMYHRRNKMNPLFNSLVIAGYSADATGAFLGITDLYGTYYEDQYVATGFGQHMAMPLLRQHARPDMTEEEARTLLAKCMEILFYRDCRASNKIQFAKATSAGVEVSREVSVQENWTHKLWLTKTIDLGKMLGASW